jgi:thiosulfate reductase cytochrome b subunit
MFALIFFIIAHVHIVAGAHPQLIVGSDLTGYLNVSSFGVLYAHGSL